MPRTIRRGTFKPKGRPKIKAAMSREYRGDKYVTQVSTWPDGPQYTRPEAQYYLQTLEEALSKIAKVMFGSNGAIITPLKRGDKRFVKAVREALEQHFTVEVLPED